jgi:hypothetical protein
MGLQFIGGFKNPLSGWKQKSKVQNKINSRRSMPLSGRLRRQNIQNSVGY